MLDLAAGCASCCLFCQTQVRALLDRRLEGEAGSAIFERFKQEAEDAGRYPGDAFERDMVTGFAFDYFVSRLHPLAQEPDGNENRCTHVHRPGGGFPDGDYGARPICQVLEFSHVGEDFPGRQVDDDVLCYFHLHW